MDHEPDPLFKKRSAQKGHLTRVVKKLKGLCLGDESPRSRDEYDINAIQENLKELDKRLDMFTDVQDQLELIVAGDQLDSFIDDYHSFCDNVKLTKRNAEKIINVRVCDDERYSVKSTDCVSARLPKINLPDFHGDVKEWFPFWDQFRVIIHDADLPSVTKFTYLRSLLKGEAKQAIHGLALTEVNYEAAISILKERYGRKERIIASHIDALLSIDIPSTTQPNLLWELVDEIQGHVRALGNLGINGEQYGVLLTPIILSRLPLDLRMEWARDEGHEGDLEHLLGFLKSDITRRERSNPMVKQGSETASALVSASSHRQDMLRKKSDIHDGTGKKNDICLICSKSNHRTEKCFSLTKLPSVNDRKDILRKNNICFKCLSGDKKHIFKKCHFSCKKCGDGHHVILCEAGKSSASHIKNVPVQVQSPSSKKVLSIDQYEPVSRAISHVSLSQHKTCSILLQVMKVKVFGEKGMAEAVVMLDTGADRSYISQCLVDKIGPEWIGSQDVGFANFGSTRTGAIKPRNVYNLNMGGIERELSISVTEIPDICAPLSKPSLPQRIIDSFQGQLNFVQAESGKLCIDMLVGLDWYWNIVSGQCTHLTEGLVAQKTIFGWMISGKIENNSHKSDTIDNNISHQLLCIDTGNSVGQNFWDLELIGIKPTEESSDDRVLDVFEKSISFYDGRYQVCLPWKDPTSKEKLMGNYNLSKARLDRLTSKLSKDPDLKGKYHEAIKNMETLGIVEEVTETDLDFKSGDSKSKYYLPHRPVVKESSLTTKVRPVFDASAKGYNGISLNDCLNAGPNLIPDLPGVLMRFCRWQYAITADITKAFLMVGVKKEDQDVHRFLWDDDGTTKVMRFTRVPFGNTCSMFLLNATIRHHLSRYTNYHTICELKENMYVDNWITGCDDIEQSCEMSKQAKEIMQEAGMTLTQWGSNCDQIGQFVNCQFGEKCIEDDSLKVLGMKWVASEDMLVYDCVQFPHKIGLTKRVMLGLISKFFDPLGFAMPFIITGRILFQCLWKLNLNWNQIVPQWISDKFDIWLKGLASLNNWKIPRKFSPFLWNKMKRIEIHAFGDASPSAYGACVYLRMLAPNGKWLVSLVFARARVAPIRQSSLPRLELLGSLLCARLAIYVLKELRLTDGTVVYCWSDSTVALAWIRNDPCCWKTFVQNRVTEIQGLVPPENWHFCPGSDNPSDLLTRGVSAEVLIGSDTWLHGPRFLRENSQDWQQFDNSGTMQSANENIEGEKRKDTVLKTTIASNPGKLFEVERWSSWMKAIRIVAFVLKFIQLLKKRQGAVSDLTYSDLCEAKTVLFHDCQRSAYPDEYVALSNGRDVSKRSSIAKLGPQMDSDGLIRIQGRLQKSLLGTEEMNPVIVPKCHIGLLLARHTHSIHKHAGVNSLLTLLRDHYWIVSARDLCKKVIHQCVSCRRHDSRALKECMAPLPQLRVRPAPPFSVTGLDHGGPLFCCDKPGKKFYILLFTCAVTRAIHLELVDSLSGESTYLAARKFMARRGVPSVFMSDNARNFKFVSEIFKHSFGPDGPRWRFIPPLSPWWGGFWERLIGLVKQGLRKEIGRKNLCFSELETVLFEIEMVLNSRPLTFVGDGLEDGEVLTPAHFLIGRKFMTKAIINDDEISSSGEMSNAAELISRWECQSDALAKFWHFWSSNYLRNLPSFKGLSGKKDIQVGELVMIRDENFPRLKWPTGLVRKVFPGSDGLTRMVELKTSKGIFIRPIQKLHSLEIVKTQDDLPPVTKDSQGMSDFVKNSVSEDEMKSRSGRILKKPNRYGSWDV